MTKMKAILVGVVATSTLYLGFAITTPQPKPNAPLSTRQKIAKAIKPKAIDKSLDKIRDEVTNLIMHEGGKWVGSPFRGGDEEATRQIVEMVIDPREWGGSLVKIAVKASKPSSTASPTDDTPGADPSTQSSHAPVPNQPSQQPSAPGNSDTSSQATQSPDRELVREHSDGPLDHGVPVSAPSTGNTANAPPSAPANQGQTTELKAGDQNMQQGLPVDIIRGDDGHYHAVPKASAAPVASSTPPPPAIQLAPVQSHTPGAGPGGDRGPMSGAHEINHGVDKPDKNTPGGRDVSPIG